ncbi:MAG: serine/threonine protein kinase [candidate division BRC1 bacterium ADurb.BinA292]|nr:MAG: serine/threonine protein kinase [candidate division BRC1 bacterium ADurb.BinA292]
MPSHLAINHLTIDSFPQLDMIREIFGLDAPRIRHLPWGHGAQLLVEDGHDAWILKRVRNPRPADQLEQILQAVRAVGAAAAGPLIPELRGTREGRVLYSSTQGHFYLMRKVSGRRPSFKRSGDTLQVLQALARFHAASRRAAPDLAAGLGLAPSVDLLAFTEARAAVMRRLNRRVRRGHAAFLTPLGRWAAARHEPARRLARRAREFCRRTGRVASAEPAGGRLACPILLAHGDTHENNFLLDGDGAWLLDLESCTPRPVVLDLLVPLHTFAQANQWPADTLLDLVAQYEAIRPLEPAERILLGSQLITPRLWLRAMHSLVKRDGRFKWSTARALWRASRAMKPHRRFARALFDHWP